MFEKVKKQSSVFSYFKTKTAKQPNKYKKHFLCYIHYYGKAIHKKQVKCYKFFYFIRAGSKRPF